MPVVGMVLKVEEESLPALLLHLREDPRFTLGDVMGGLLPLVLESNNREEEYEALAMLAEQPGMLAADPVWADFSDLNLEVRL